MCWIVTTCCHNRPSMDLQNACFPHIKPSTRFEQCGRQFCVVRHRQRHSTPRRGQLATLGSNAGNLGIEMSSYTLYGWHGFNSQVPVDGTYCTGPVEAMLRSKLNPVAQLTLLIRYMSYRKTRGLTFGSAAHNENLVIPNESPFFAHESIGVPITTTVPVAKMNLSCLLRIEF